jgi:hypothetical protein
MNVNKKVMSIVSIALIFAFGLGIAIGASVDIKGLPFAKGLNNKATLVSDASLGEESVEELGTKLSGIMLPEDEFLKLESAIYQTAMGLFMAQAQGAGINVTEAAQQELKKNLDEKYSRKYFSDMNADSMKELDKNELVSILSFYQTAAGQKFLALSPKAIQATMATVQADLSAWLPRTVDALVAKLKGANTDEKKDDDKKDDLQKEPLSNQAPAKS